MCKAYNVSYSMYVARRQRGVGIAEDLTTPRHFAYTEKSGRTIRYNDREYASIAALCREFGADTARVRNRLQHGWPIDKALTEPTRAMNLRDMMR